MRRVLQVAGRKAAASCPSSFGRNRGHESRSKGRKRFENVEHRRHVGDVLDAAFGRAQAVVVLMTPDDVAYLHPSLTYDGDPETESYMQPRPNVLYEAGMAMGRNPDRTVIVEFGQVKVFSDIHGRHGVHLDNTVAKRQDLAERLRTAECAVDTIGTDWHQAGDLTPPVAPGGGLPLGRKLPKSQLSAVPRLDGRYIDNGNRKLSAVEVTNHGPGDVYELDLEDAERDGIRLRRLTCLLPKLPRASGGPRLP